MGRLEVNSEVKVLSMASDDGRTQHEAAMEYIGRVGKITQDDGGDRFPYRVDFPDADWHFFNHNELEVVQPAPADADAPASGRAGAGTEGESYELAALRQQLAAAEADNARLRSALEPFGVQWAEWKKFAENGGEVGIVEFFTDCMENEVLARDLRDAANALAAEGAKGE